MAKYQIVERHDDISTWWTARGEDGGWVKNTQTQVGADECERKLKLLVPARPDVVVKEVEL